MYREVCNICFTNYMFIYKLLYTPIEINIECLHKYHVTITELYVHVCIQTRRGCAWNASGDNPYAVLIIVVFHLRNAKKTKSVTILNI